MTVFSVFNIRALTWMICLLSHWDHKTFPQRTSQSTCFAGCLNLHQQSCQQVSCSSEICQRHIRFLVEVDAVLEYPVLSTFLYRVQVLLLEKYSTATHFFSSVHHLSQSDLQFFISAFSLVPLVTFLFFMVELQTSSPLFETSQQLKRVWLKAEWIKTNVYKRKRGSGSWDSNLTKGCHHKECNQQQFHHYWGLVLHCFLMLNFLS